MSKSTASRDTERETALILHDVQASPTLRHVRGLVVQLRGDVFDRESAAGNCVAHGPTGLVDLTLLPDPLPTDTTSPRLERMRRELLMVGAAVEDAKARRVEEVASDLAHREALQASHTAYAAENGIKAAKRGMAQTKK